ncbi:phosphatidate cytidylyltransferase [Ruminococcus albus]|uniref:Phosphatidate cytidylyltransferase n=1 Tax=Ruminococcus albus (strain ATCC 27210 / DSM 20455 / JCM 14654 / NCDO 2250 / 7) TaxID=697329 RepID=E6UBJ4_RUMA7|nr:phosphatidate cytidylyltransferase [Ruminococcus albus]ADU22614.1 phosphatidate cytidylyltransferase [Ruminococcus albus 7 = DSM 20455]
MSTRIISAAVALVAAIILVALHSTFLINLAVGALSVLAVYEVFKAVGYDKYKYQNIACMAFAAIDAIVPYFIFRMHTLYFFSYRCYLGIFVLTMCILYLKDHKTLGFTDFFGMLGTTVLISYAFGTLIKLAQDDDIPFNVADGAKGRAQVYLMVISLAAAWLADSGAYFVGTFFNKTGREVHHPWPEISPNKTLEGLVGGVITNGLILVITSLVFDLVNPGFKVNYIVVFAAGMVSAIIGLVGDLTASMIKRQTGIKDYGNIMPGHGGVMDRFDSALLVVPFICYLASQGVLIVGTNI